LAARSQKFKEKNGEKEVETAEKRRFPCNGATNMSRTENELNAVRKRTVFEPRRRLKR